VKIQKPAAEIEVCDICHREGYLQTCLVCRARYCMAHRAIIAGCWVGVFACINCQDRDDVREIVERHAAQITPIIEARRAELAGLLASGGVEVLQEEAT